MKAYKRDEIGLEGTTSLERTSRDFSLPQVWQGRCQLWRADDELAPQPLGLNLWVTDQQTERIERYRSCIVAGFETLVERSICPPKNLCLRDSFLSPRDRSFGPYVGLGIILEGNLELKGGRRFRGRFLQPSWSSLCFFHVVRWL